MPTERLWPLALPNGHLRPMGYPTYAGTCANADLAEHIGKAVSTVTKAPDALALCAHACFVQSVLDCRATLVRRSLSRALRVGRVLLNEHRAGNDAVVAAAEACEGVILFRGSVTSKDWKDESGYMVGTTSICGSDKRGGSQAKIWLRMRTTFCG